jgi:hypothetical protein
MKLNRGLFKLMNTPGKIQVLHIDEVIKEMNNIMNRYNTKGGILRKITAQSAIAEINKNKTTTLKLLLSSVKLLSNRQAYIVTLAYAKHLKTRLKQ